MDTLLPETEQFSVETLDEHRFGELAVVRGLAWAVKKLDEGLQFLTGNPTVIPEAQIHAAEARSIH